MNHRRSDVRAAVFARQRSQGHLRAVTVTAGIAGIVTAGAVAAILPGSTHASASPHAAARPAPATTRSPASTARNAAPAASAAGTATKHRQSPSPPRAEGPGGRPGHYRARRPGTHPRRDQRAAADHVRRLLTCPVPVPRQSRDAR